MVCLCGLDDVPVKVAADDAKPRILIGRPPLAERALMALEQGQRSTSVRAGVFTLTGHDGGSLSRACSIPDHNVLVGSAAGC